mgnify:CR=1 FL=1
MLARDPQVVIGVSYAHKNQLRSLPSAPNVPQTNFTAEGLVTGQPGGEYTPRGGGKLE